MSLHIRVGLETSIAELDALRRQIEDYLRLKDVLEVTIQFEGCECSYSAKVLEH